MKIINIDLNKRFKHTLSFADNFKQFFETLQEFKFYNFSIYNDEGEEIYVDPYDDKYHIINESITEDIIAEYDTLEEVLLTKFTDGMTIFEYLTGEKPIIEV